MLRRRPQRHRRRAGRDLAVAGHHGRRPRGALVRPAPAPRQLADRRPPRDLDPGAAGQARLADDRADGPPARRTGRADRGPPLPAARRGLGRGGRHQEAKELAPDQAAALRKWQKEVTKKPTSKQLDRLRALARRVERLWELTLRRLQISEREIARDILGLNATAQREVPLQRRTERGQEILRKIHPARDARVATINVAGVTVQLKKPTASRKSKDDAGTLSVNVVRVWESGSPKARRPSSGTCTRAEPMKTTEQLLAIVTTTAHAG